MSAPLFDVVFSLMVLITVGLIAAVIVTTVPIVRRDRRFNAARSARWAEVLRSGLNHPGQTDRVLAEPSAAGDEQEDAA